MVCLKFDTAQNIQIWSMRIWKTQAERKSMGKDATNSMPSMARHGWQVALCACGVPIVSAMGSTASLPQKAEMMCSLPYTPGGRGHPRSLYMTSLVPFNLTAWPGSLNFSRKHCSSSTHSMQWAIQNVAMQHFSILTVKPTPSYSISIQVPQSAAMVVF